MSTEYLRIRTDKGEVAHLAQRMYGGGYRTLCGRNVERAHTEPHLATCWPCLRRAQERGIAVKP